MSLKNQKSYTLVGLEEDQETEKYLDGILQDRVSQDIETESDAEKPGAVQYLEQVAQEELLKGMHAKGYYNAQVTYEDQSDKGQYRITPGQRSVIRHVSILPENYAPYLKKSILKEGDPLEAAVVLKTQNDIFNLIQKEICAFDLDIDHQVVLDQKIYKADVTYHVMEGVRSQFGAVQFTGQTSIREDFLKKLVPWKEGECFRHDTLNTFREKVLGTGLFSTVDVVLPSAPDQDGNVPIEVVLKERAQRSIQAGMSYYTDEGLGVVLGWEHRNFLGGAEKFNADLTLSMLEQVLEFNMVKPYFWRDDQTLSLNSALSRHDTDAYEEYSAGSGFRLNRTFSKKWTGSTGADLKITKINEENGETRTFGLLSPSVSAVFDTRNDKLDPRKGWLLSAAVTPYFDVLGESSPFIKTQFTAQTYKALGKRTVFAVRGNVGSLIGTDNLDIPATERFYAGGGGSVRGFGYQEIGPHEDGDPVGGRSLVEGSAELRFKLTDKIGTVAFVDAGQVSEKPALGFDKLSVGAGVGLRYYTDFGPLRFDVATPISGDEDTDQNYQIYISIGQAF